jgi:hypothetical protein
MKYYARLQIRHPNATDGAKGVPHYTSCFEMAVEGENKPDATKAALRLLQETTQLRDPESVKIDCYVENSPPKIVLSPFAKERDQGLCQIPLEEKVPLVLEKFPHAHAGYRPGVLLVPIPDIDFLGKIVTLREGDRLQGAFRRRKENEEPRKEIRVHPPEQGGPHPARLTSVDVVLYHHDVLAEGNENSDPEADYEIIAFVPKITRGNQPMTPETLMANHFTTSGGTATGMGPQQFEAELRESFNFWKDKALLP